MSPHSATEDPKTPAPKPGQWIWLSHGSRFLCHVKSVSATHALLLMDDLAETVQFSLADLATADRAFYGQWRSKDRRSYPEYFTGPFAVATGEEVKAYLDGQQQAFRRMKQAAAAFEIEREGLKRFEIVTDG